MVECTLCRSQREGNPKAQASPSRAGGLFSTRGLDSAGEAAAPQVPPGPPAVAGGKSRDLSGMVRFVLAQSSLAGLLDPV